MGKTERDEWYTRGEIRTPYRTALVCFQTIPLSPQTNIVSILFVSHRI